MGDSRLVYGWVCVWNYLYVCRLDSLNKGLNMKSTKKGKYDKSVKHRNEVYRQIRKNSRVKK